MAAQDQSALFSSLVERYGFGTAMALWGILGGNESDVSKALSGASTAGSLAAGAGTLAGVPALSTIGGGLGTAAGLGATGYNLYNIATDPNLSTGQKAGHAGVSAGEGVAAAYVPYLGLALAANALGKGLEGSGSPQVKSAGTFLDTLSEPHGLQGALSVILGDKSPAAAFKDQGGWQGAAYDITNALAPGVGSAFEAMGIKLPFLTHTPTTGTMMRDESARSAASLGIKGFDPTADALTTAQYNAIPTAQQQAAYNLATIIGARSADYQKNPKAYQIQLGNSLLKQFGPNVIPLATMVAQRLLPTPAAPTPTAGDPNLLAASRAKTLPFTL